MTAGTKRAERANGSPWPTSEQFLYREARLADEHDYDGWEALWTDDGIYWIPAGGASAEDPDTQDVHRLRTNRSRIALRVAQLKERQATLAGPPPVQRAPNDQQTWS